MGAVLLWTGACVVWAVIDDLVSSGVPCSVGCSLADHVVVVFVGLGDSAADSCWSDDLVSSDCDRSVVDSMVSKCG